MKVLFDEISDNKRSFLFEDPDWLDLSDLAVTMPVKTEITLHKKDERTVVMTGQLSSEALLNCDRCGKEFRQPLSTDFFYTFKSGEDDDLQQYEFECSDEDCYTVYLVAPAIDFAEVLREQMVLVVPQSRVCNENCKGLCTGCGGDLNTGSCECTGENVQSPFAVLKKLKK